MTIGKRERIGLAVLLVALSALAVDRFVLGPPTPAEAAAAGDPALPPENKKGVLDLPAVKPTTTRPALVAPPDVFDWSRLGQAFARPAAAEISVDEAAARATEFGQKHALRGTVLGPRPVALIGDRTLTVGDVLDGFTLSAIRRDEVEFVLDKQQVILHVPRGRGN